MRRSKLQELVRGCYITGFDDTLQGARPPVPPGIGGGSATELAFPGVSKPSTDFQAVRDGRRAGMLGYLVDLTNARSIAAGTHLPLPIAGNVFHSDPLWDLTGAAQAGIARVHFQDENLSPSGTYVTALPGSIYRVPFTQLMVENYAQPGKFLYIVYGVDLDLVPGESQQVQATILGTATVGGDGGTLGQNRVDNGADLLSATRWAALTRDVGYVPGVIAYTATALAANSAEEAVARASNVNGAMLWTASYQTGNITGYARFQLNIHNAVPGALGTGQPAPLARKRSWDGSATPVFSQTGELTRPIFIPAGFGAFWITDLAEGSFAPLRSVHCTYF